MFDKKFLHKTIRTAFGIILVIQTKYFFKTARFELTARGRLSSAVPRYPTIFKQSIAIVTTCEPSKMLE